MSAYTPTTEVIRHAVTFPRERLGEPRPIKPEVFDRWLDKIRREAKAEAWDEGHDAGWEDRHVDALINWVPSGPHESDAHNPYRKETEA